MRCVLWGRWITIYKAFFADVCGRRDSMYTYNYSHTACVLTSDMNRCDVTWHSYVPCSFKINIALQKKLPTYNWMKLCKAPEAVPITSGNRKVRKKTKVYLDNNNYIKCKMYKNCIKYYSIIIISLISQVNTSHMQSKGSERSWRSPLYSREFIPRQLDEREVRTNKHIKLYLHSPILFITLGKLVSVAKKFSHNASNVFVLLSSEALAKNVLMAFVQYSETSGYSSLARDIRASSAKGTDVCIALKEGIFFF